MECCGISVVCCHPEEAWRAVEDGIFEFRAEIGLDRNTSVLVYISQTEMSCISKGPATPRGDRQRGGGVHVPHLPETEMPY